ncbi:MAG: OadG family protein [Bacteroidota bacterium]
MEGVFGTALMLLLVGMITVFFVLFMVVILGKLLIRLVNAFHKEAPTHKKDSLATINQALPPNKLAAIVTTVEVVTQGKGNIKSIDKID